MANWIDNWWNLSRWNFAANHVRTVLSSCSAGNSKLGLHNFSMHSSISYSNVVLCRLMKKLFCNRKTIYNVLSSAFCLLSHFVAWKVSEKLVWMINIVRIFFQSKISFSLEPICVFDRLILQHEKIVRLICRFSKI